MLELNNLSFFRDDRCIFAQLSLAIAPGEVVQVVGPNGAGKTTLLQIATTLLQPELTPNSSNIRWRGQPLPAARDDYLSELLFIGHKPAVNPALTVLENIRWLAGLRATRSGVTVDQAIIEIGLAGYEDAPAYSLSAGQQRRIALARLLINDVALWVLDEPFTALDKTGVAQLTAMIEGHASGGGAVLLTSHQPLAMPGLRQFDLLQYQPPGAVA